MRLFSAQFLLLLRLFLVGVCASQNPLDSIQLTLDAMAKQQHQILQKLNALEIKMETQLQQGDVRNTLQKCTSTRNQLTAFQDLLMADECDENNCSSLATCIDGVGHYKCACKQGYSGDGFTCEDIDECKTDTGLCGEGGICINHPGTYGCICHHGFKEVNNFCRDVDECRELTNACADKMFCTNYIGNYNCTCIQGYTKEEGVCQDTDECIGENSCHLNADCTNTIGSYSCSCRPYYYGNGYLCYECQDELISTRGLSAEEMPMFERICGSNCKELLDNGIIRSGVYRITPEGFPDGVEVYCDQETDGGGWTVFLQRKQLPHKIPFNRTWEEYAAGFGDPNGEVWMGNSVLHAMTKDKPFTLRVEVQDFDGQWRTGIWNKFSVGSEDTQFTLSISDYSSSSSTLGNGLSNEAIPYTSKNMKFSTIDKDNDEAKYYDCCKHSGGGGWWYKNCASVNPTARLAEKPIYNVYFATWKFWDKENNQREVAISEIKFKIRP